MKNKVNPENKLIWRVPEQGSKVRSLLRRNKHKVITIGSILGAAAIALGTALPLTLINNSSTSPVITANVVHNCNSFYYWDEANYCTRIDFQQINHNYKDGVEYEFSEDGTSFSSLNDFTPYLDAHDLYAWVETDNFSIIELDQPTASFLFYIKTIDSTSAVTTPIYCLNNVPEENYNVGGPSATTIFSFNSVPTTQYDAIFIPKTIVKLEDNLFFNNVFGKPQYKYFVFQDRNLNSILDTGVDAFFTENTSNTMETNVYIGYGKYVGSGLDSPKLFTAGQINGGAANILLNTVFINGDLSNYGSMFTFASGTTGYEQTANALFHANKIIINGNITMVPLYSYVSTLFYVSAGGNQQGANLTFGIDYLEINSKISSVENFMYVNTKATYDYILGDVKFGANSSLQANNAFVSDGQTPPTNVIINSMTFDKSYFDIYSACLNFPNVPAASVSVNEINITNGAIFNYWGANPPLHIDNPQVDSIDWVSIWE